MVSGVDEWYEHRLQEKFPWMSAAQCECLEMVYVLFGGAHHVYGRPKRYGSGIEINLTAHGMSTFDSDYLTRAVLMAHDRCIRFCIEPSGPGRLKFILHKRYTREGRMHERHPTIEDAIEAFNASRDKIKPTEPA